MDIGIIKQKQSYVISQVGSVYIGGIMYILFIFLKVKLGVLLHDFNLW